MQGFDQRICVGYPLAMATEGPMKNRVIRVDDATWAEFGEFCDAKGLSRSAELRVHMRALVADWRRQQRKDARES